MARQGYVTPLQRDAQAFAVQRAELDLEVAETAITVLEKFTKAKTLVGLESTRDSAEARMASEKAAFELEEDRLEAIASSSWRSARSWRPTTAWSFMPTSRCSGRRSSSQVSPVEEGAIMRERQTIDQAARSVAHAGQDARCTSRRSISLQRGMRARIRIQDHEYQGVVTSVANQPEPSDWFSGTVKEYAAIVSIDSEPHGLRPGMTAAVEILVANLKDVLSVPVQSVVEKSGKFYCWVNDARGPEKRPVVLGMSNNTRIEIKDGVKEGDDVLLNPRATVEEAREDERSRGEGRRQEEVRRRQAGSRDAPPSRPPAARGAAAAKGQGRRPPAARS